MKGDRTLASHVWPSVDGGDVLLVPLGSTEQHGPHLPLDTDARIAEAIAVGAARRTNTIVAPTMPYGASGEHAGFAGTLSIGSDALRRVVIELVRSAMSTFGRVVFVNGHGGNHEAVASAVSQMVDEGHHVAMWSPRVEGADAHAGRTETSIMLAIAPALVRLERVEPGNTSSLADLMPALRSGGVAAVSDNGVLGDPTGASAAEGRSILSLMVDDLISFLNPQR